MFGMNNRKTPLSRIFTWFIVLVVFVGVGKFLIPSGEPSLTGQVITDIPQEVPIAKSLTADTTEEETIEDSTQEDIEDEEDYEVYEYYEYGGECSKNIKTSEKDVESISLYIDDRKDTYKTLKEEYNQKLDDLRDQYEIPIENAKQEYENEQGALIDAQNTLQELQEVCSF